MKSARVVLFFLAAAAAVAVWSSSASAQGPAPIADPKSTNQVGFPATLYSWVIPPDNQQTPAKIALGKALFFEDALSADGKISCDHCHSPAKGFTDQLPTSMGIHAQFGQRNAPSILNALFNVTQFWDGRSPTLEAQIEGPVTNPVEMGMKSTDDAVAAIKAIPRVSEAIPGSLRARRQLRRYRACDRGVRAYAGRIRFAVRQVHQRRSERDQRFGQAWMVDIQRQGPMHVLSRMESDVSRCSPIRSSTTSECRRIRQTSCRSRARRSSCSATTGGGSEADRQAGDWHRYERTRAIPGDQAAA